MAITVRGKGVTGMGCHNNWHIHHAEKGGGQILICTAGEGWYQEEGKEPQELFPWRFREKTRETNGSNRYRMKNTIAGIAYPPIMLLIWIL